MLATIEKLLLQLINIIGRFYSEYTWKLVNRITMDCVLDNMFVKVIILNRLHCSQRTLLIAAPTS